MKRMLLMLLCILAGMQTMKAEKEAYAVYSAANTMLTFYYDELRSSRTGTTYDLNTEGNSPEWYTDGTYASVTFLPIAGFTRWRTCNPSRESAG